MKKESDDRQTWVAVFWEMHDGLPKWRTDIRVVDAGLERVRRGTRGREGRIESF
jgi:hypothetical protein